MYPNFHALSMTMGCDPEVFAVEGTDVIPAYKFLPGKDNPVPVRSVAGGDYGASVFWDGVQAEMTVVPHQCLGWLADNIQAGLKGTLASAKNYKPAARLTLQNVIHYPKAERARAKRVHVELGCSPSVNVYGMGGRMPGDGRELPVRFAGGHLHLSSNLLLDARDRAVKWLDKVLGVWSVGAAACVDNPIRRQYYGLAGEYRPTKYGIEYRVLSNFWLAHPAIFHCVFEIARVLTATLAVPGFEQHWLSDAFETTQVINRCDVIGARKILARNEGLLRHMLCKTQFSHGYASPAVDRAIRAGMQGLHNVIPGMRDIEANWKLEGSWAPHTDNYSRGWINLVDTPMPIVQAQPVEAVAR